MEHLAFFKYNKDFLLFGDQHFIILVGMTFLCIALPLFARQYLNAKQQLFLSRLMAITIFFWAIIYPIILMWLGKFNYKTDLPLDVCNITALALPFLMWKPTLRYHEVFYFWILAGTMQAIITPHLFNGFPNFIFIKYWMVHSGLVVFTVYVTIVFDLKPTLKSIKRSFLALQGYVIFILVVNLLIGSNYVYLLSKPPTASLLDFLGPWPWYLLVCEVLALLMFFVVYFPVWVLGKLSLGEVE
jgi:hypothetical integral membrane protein (TIGR02206 family)